MHAPIHPNNQIHTGLQADTNDATQFSVPCHTRL
jgi:hypothetical protein